MTTKKVEKTQEECPVQSLLKQLSGKWKMDILLLSFHSTLRFNYLMKTLKGVNKQSLTTALRELEEDGFLIRTIISEKPLHIEYLLAEKGKNMLPLFKEMEGLIQINQPE